ncbi:MAG: lipopolysaccharide heptosyltransferase II [Betaproteobacteria bacterium AqS2]|uniref:lipopolysaccharide heptosyltransferase II n=1 Tax=Candidatus Amphirhobacter heronislandensis TaxID=1732024 RepID=A0A930Y144_9GAMM|nr:lipopolysaccharide heptosyltransferase II [Betaproteobacteria bacterium AqS2]
MGAARLVIPALPGIGDMLMAHGLIQILRQQDADAPIDLIASPNSAPVARLLPEIRDVFELRASSGEMRPVDFLATVRQARQRRYAAAYSVHINPKLTLIPWLAGVPRRLGFERARHSATLFTQALPSISPPSHFAREMATLAKPGETDFDLPSPRLEFGSKELHKLPKDLQDLAAGGRLVALCPGGVTSRHKRWPAAHYARLAAWLADQGFAVAILGNAADADEARQIAAQAKHPAIHDLAGKAKLVDALKLLSRCKALVANDTGIMHAGAALGIVTLGIFTITNPHMFGPLGPRAHHIAPARPSCHPDAISAKAVIAKLETLLPQD